MAIVRWLLLLGAVLYSLNQINSCAELMCRHIPFIPENQEHKTQVVKAAKTLPFPLQLVVRAAKRLPFPIQMDREGLCKSRCGLLSVLGYHPERCGRCWWKTSADGRPTVIRWEYPEGPYYFFGALVQAVTLVWTFLKLGF